jgi:hypothetical protein
MKIVYIAHPISGDVQGNVAKILQIIKRINLGTLDIVPFVPYLSDVLSLDDNIKEQRLRGILNDTHILKSKVVDELWFDDSRISKGVAAEMLLCQKLGIPTISVDFDILYIKDYPV